MAFIQTLLKVPKPAPIAAPVGGAAGAAVPAIPAPVGGAVAATTPTTPPPIEPTQPLGPTNDGSAEDAAAQSPGAIAASTYSVPPPANPPQSGTPPDAQAGGTTTFHSTKTNQDYASQAELDAAEGAYDTAQNQNQQAQNPGNNGTETAAGAGAAPAAPTNTAQTGTPYDDLITQAKALSTNTEDPAFKVAFNRAVTSMGLASDAQRAKLQEQILQNPALAGQPSGTALLMMAARDSNLSFDQAIAQLSEQSAQHISDMNKYGLGVLQQVTTAREQYKQTQLNDLISAGDYEGYADQVEANTGHRPDISELKASSPATVALANTLVQSIQNAIANGDTARATTLFTQLQGVQPKTYGSLTLNDLVSSSQQYAARTAVTDALDTRARNDWEKVAAGGDPTQVINDLHQRYTEDESVKGGQALIDDKTNPLTLDEANRLLKQAGMESVTSLDQLTADGRQDDLFIAKQLDKIAAGATNAAQTYTKNAKTYATMLGLDPTNPDVVTSLSTFLRQNPFTIGADGSLTFNSASIQDPLSTTDPTNSISQHYVDWPVVDVDGKTIYGGWQPYSPDNKQAAPGSPTYQFENTLNSAYENYLSTPGDHVSRQDWFKSVTGNNDNWKDGVLTPSAQGTLSPGKTVGLTGATNYGDTPPSKKDSDILDQTYDPGAEKDAVKQAAFASSFQDLTPDQQKAWLAAPANATKALKFGILGDYSSASKLTYSDADYAEKAAVNGGWVIGPDRKAYQMVKTGGDNYGANLSGVGFGFVALDSTGNPVFIVTKTTPGGQPVGNVLKLTETTEKPTGGKGSLSYGNTGAAADGRTTVNGKYYTYAGGA